MNRVEMTDLSPVLQPGAETPAVEAVVTSEITQRKFESYTGKLLRQEGQTKAKAWTIRVLSVGLVLPVVITAIVDLGRGLGFIIGNKNATARKYFTGKTVDVMALARPACTEFSEKVKAAAQKTKAAFAQFASQAKVTFGNLATRAKEAYKKATTTTQDEMNAKSKLAMKSDVKQIVDAFRALDKADAFTAARMQPIVAAEKKLIAEMKKYVSANTTTAEDCVEQFKSLRESVLTMIDESAKDDLFITNKAQFDDAKSLAKIAKAHLAKPLHNTFRDQFIQMAKAQDNFAECLALGLENSILTRVEAEAALKEQAPSIFSAGLSQGIDHANSAIKKQLDAAVKKNVVTQLTAKHIDETMKVSLDALAHAAVDEILKSSGEVDPMISSIVTKLRNSNRLAAKDVTTFTNKVKALIEAAKLSAEEQKAAEAAAAAEAEATAAVQAKLVANLTGLQELIRDKKQTLSETLASFKGIDAERKKIAVELAKVVSSKAGIQYYKEMASIEKSESNMSKRQARIDKLIQSGDIAETVVQLQNLAAELRKKEAELSPLDAEIRTLTSEVARLSQLFERYSVHHRAELSPANQKRFGLTATAEIKHRLVKAKAAEIAANDEAVEALFQGQLP